MGLVEEARQVQKGRRQGTPCTVGVLLEGMDPKERDEVNAALADRTLGAPAIAIALEGRGHQIAVGSIERHRKATGGCICEKPWLKT